METGLPTQSPGLRFHLVAAGLLLLVAGVYAATLHDDQNWGDDFAQYILQARNILQRRDMAETGYVYQAEIAELGPRTYPPGFPLLLAPVYGLAGVDMLAFQAELAVLQLLALVVTYAVFRREVREPTALVLLFMLALSPYVIEFKREIRPDIAAWLGSWLFLLWVARRAGNGIREGAAAGVLAGVYTLLRTVGSLALVALLIAHMLRPRYSRWFLLAAVGAALSIVAAARLVWGGGEESYLDQLSGWHFGLVPLNVHHYLMRAMRGFWAGPSIGLGREEPLPVLWLAALPLSVVGFVQRARRSDLLFECFFALQLAVVLAWPSRQELRFLYPILPLWLLYAGLGFEHLLTRLRRHAPALAQGVAVATAGGLLLIYGVRAAKIIAADGPAPDGPYTASAQELFEFVRARTPADATLVFFKPRALALYTGRCALAPAPQSPPGVAAQLDRVGVQYAVATVDATLPNAGSLVALVKSCPSAFALEFSNDRYRVYHIDAPRLRTCAAPG